MLAVDSGAGCRACRGVVIDISLFAFMAAQICASPHVTQPEPNCSWHATNRIEFVE